jgi:hypothetical protein
MLLVYLYIPICFFSSGLVFAEDHLFIGEELKNVVAVPGKVAKNAKSPEEIHEFAGIQSDLVRF